MHIFSFIFLFSQNYLFLSFFYSKCNIFVNSKLLAEAYGSNQKLAKKEASVIGLHELQKHYYTIKVCNKVFFLIFIYIKFLI